MKGKMTLKEALTEYGNDIVVINGSSDDFDAIGYVFPVTATTMAFKTTERKREEKLRKTIADYQDMIENYKSMVTLYEARIANYERMLEIREEQLTLLRKYKDTVEDTVERLLNRIA